MPRIPSGLGRTVFIALLAGVMFAGFLLVTPRLMASSRDASPGTTTTLATTTTSAAPTTTAPTTTMPVATTTTLPAPTTTTTHAMTPENGYDGSVVLTVDLVQHGKNEFRDGDDLRWHFVVENASEGTLWGVFLYLELHGHVPCHDKILEPGETTDCWARTTAVEGAHTAEAWVTAWTLHDMVKDKLFLDLLVLP